MRKWMHHPALVALLTLVATPPTAAQAPIEGEVRASSAGNTIRVRVVNESSAAAEGVVARVLGAPEGVWSIAVDPARIDRIEPGAEAVFVVSFDVAPRAPVGDLSDFEIEVTAERGRLRDPTSVVDLTVLERPRRVASCNQRVEADEDYADTVTIDTGDFSGETFLRWRMGWPEDRMRLFAGERLLHDTGCVAGSGEARVEMPTQMPTGEALRLEVDPACGGPSPGWSFSLECRSAADQVLVLTRILGPESSEAEHEERSAGYVARTSREGELGTYASVESVAFDALPERIVLGEAFSFVARRRARVDHPPQESCSESRASPFGATVLMETNGTLEEACGDPARRQQRCRLDSWWTESYVDYRFEGQTSVNPFEFRCEDTAPAGDAPSGRTRPLYGGVTKQGEATLELTFEPASPPNRYDVVLAERNGGGTVAVDGSERIEGGRTEDLYLSGSHLLLVQLGGLRLVYEPDGQPVVARGFTDPADFDRPPVGSGLPVDPVADDTTRVADTSGGGREPGSTEGDLAPGAEPDGGTSVPGDGSGGEETSSEAAAEVPAVPVAGDRVADTLDGPGVAEEGTDDEAVDVGPDVTRIADTFRPTTVEVPRLLGVDLAAARRRLDERGLVARVEIGRPAPTPADEGLVAGQDPDAGRGVSPGSMVRVTLFGPARVALPDLRGLDLASARGELERRGLASRVTIGEPARSQTEQGTVSAQSPDPRESPWVRPGAVVSLTLRGPYVPPAPPTPPAEITPPRPRTTTVPPLVGYGLAEARSRLDGRGLTARVRIGPPAPTTAVEGQVTAQQPWAGETVAIGSEVEITLFGPAPPTVEPGGEGQEDQPGTRRRPPPPDCSDRPGSVPEWFDGAWACLCPPPMSWDSERNRCVDHLSEMQQSCERSYPGSVYQISVETGEIVCVCPSGKAWNSSRTACVDPGASGAPPPGVAQMAPFVGHWVCPGKGWLDLRLGRAGIIGTLGGDSSRGEGWGPHRSHRQGGTFTAKAIEDGISYAMRHGDGTSTVGELGLSEDGSELLGFWRWLAGDGTFRGSSGLRCKRAGNPRFPPPGSTGTRGTSGNQPPDDCRCRDADGRRYRPMLGQDCGGAESLRMYCD